MSTLYPQARPHGLAGRAHTSPRRLALGALLAAMLLLSGCASIHRSADRNPWSYNATTGYPAVGYWFPQ